MTDQATENERRSILYMDKTMQQLADQKQALRKEAQDFHMTINERLLKFEHLNQNFLNVGDFLKKFESRLVSLENATPGNVGTSNVADLRLERSLLQARVHEMTTRQPPPRARPTTA